jgi:hypothetical protein
MLLMMMMRRRRRRRAIACFVCGLGRMLVHEVFFCGQRDLQLRRTSCGRKLQRDYSLPLFCLRCTVRLVVATTGNGKWWVAKDVFFKIKFAFFRIFIWVLLSFMSFKSKFKSSSKSLHFYFAKNIIFSSDVLYCYTLSY